MTGRDRGSWLRRSPRGGRSSVLRHERVAHALVACAATRDEPALARLLDPGVALAVDGGGKVPAPVAAVEGADAVASYLTGMLLVPQASLRVETVNGLPGIVVCQGGAVTGILGFRVRNRVIVEAWLVLNPDKLTNWRSE